MGVEVTIANTSAGPLEIDVAGGAVMADADGRRYRAVAGTVDPRSLRPIPDLPTQLAAQQLSEGATVGGMVVFEVPTRAIPREFALSLGGSAEDASRWALTW